MFNVCSVILFSETTVHFKMSNTFNTGCSVYLILQRISVTVNSGLQMCRGGSSDPTVVVQIWSIGVFGKDKNSAYTDSLFEFFKKHLPSVSEKR